jgi:SH3-like domain-containing protein
MAGILLVVPDPLTTITSTIMITFTTVTTNTTTTTTSSRTVPNLASLKAVNPQDDPYPLRGLSALELAAHTPVTVPTQVFLRGAEGRMANFALDHAV